MRFALVTEALKSAFALDAIEESQSVADLQFSIGATLASIMNEDEEEGSRARVEIDRAFAAWAQAARVRTLARQRRLGDLLAAHGFAAPKPRGALREMLAQAARAVAELKVEEEQMRAWAVDERALVDEWSGKARLARNIGEADLAAQADARAADHARKVGELERELTIQTTAREKLEGQLAELRRSVG